MRRHKADKLTHKRLVEIHLLSSLINRRRLYHIPVVKQTHNIVIPADMALKDFSCAWVMNIRTVCILNR